MSRRVRVKPGKGQSLAGFFFGIIFCFIGLFVVIPTLGPFGFIWTLFAVVITVINGVNAFSDKGVASHEITIEDEYIDKSSDYNRASDYSMTSENNKSEERLNELQNLYNKGMITAAEYQEKRKKILEEL